MDARVDPTIDQFSKQVNLSTRDRLEEQRRFQKDSIMKVMTQVVGAQIILYVTLRGGGLDHIAHLFAIVGLVVAAGSMYIVRAHNVDLLEILWKGYLVEEKLKNYGADMEVELFDEPPSKKLGIFTAPMVTHTLMIIVWLVVLWRATF